VDEDIEAEQGESTVQEEPGEYNNTVADDAWVIVFVPGSKHFTPLQLNSYMVYWTYTL